MSTEMTLSDEVLYDLCNTYTTLYGVLSFDGKKKADLSDHAKRIGIPILRSDTRDAIIQKMLPYVLKGLEMKKKSEEDTTQRIEEEKNDTSPAANTENVYTNLTQFEASSEYLTVGETIAYLQKLVDTSPTMAHYTVSIGYDLFNKEGAGTIRVVKRDNEIIFY
jgi:hypothetical protein